MTAMYNVKPQATPVALNEQAAATYLSRSRAFLRLARMQGRGPAFVKVGRSVLYLIADLDAWLDQHRVQPGSAA